MKPLLTAKQLTIRYFSIVAIAMTAVHYSVFELTTDDLEYAFVQTRLNKIHEFIQSEVKNDGSITFENINIFTQEKFQFDTPPKILLEFSTISDSIPPINSLLYNQAMEIDNEKSSHDYYVMKIRLNIKNQQRDALLLIDNGLYEISEEQLVYYHTKQITITIVLTLLSLIVIIQMSRKLTLPIAALSKTLSSQNPADLNISPLTTEANTQELADMVCTFNLYQSKIQELIERERSFNCYASHELRSPLMVMKGALTLLNESDGKAFKDRQLLRLEKATEEMTEFVETLLSLTKPSLNDGQNEIEINTTLVGKVVENHTHLIQYKNISWQVHITGTPRIQIPEAIFHILLGNLIKNAFAYTEEGKIKIEATPHQLRVIDTGKGFESDKIKGYGLGLLLVRDIAKRFGYEFELLDNLPHGTIARLMFTSKQ